MNTRRTGWNDRPCLCNHTQGDHDPFHLENINGNIVGAKKCRRCTCAFFEDAKLAAQKSS